MSTEFTPKFTELKLPLGAYQTVTVKNVGPAYPTAHLTPPVYWINFGAAMRDPFKIENTLMLLDHESLRRMQMLCALLKNPLNPASTYKAILGNIDYFHLEEL